MYKFRIKAAANDQFRVQFLYNSEVMVWSENYKSKSGAKNCIESLKAHVPGASIVDTTAGETGSGYRFEIKKTSNGEFMVNFIASNGEPMVRSESYASKSSAKNCAESMKKNAPSAEIIDETA